MDVENITHNGERLALIVRGNTKIEGKNFVSPKEDYLQVGFMKLEKDEKICPHIHKINKRIIEKSHEVLYIISGKMKVNFYKNKTRIKSTIINTGDLIILISGGHGFEFLEETKLFEVKQGPYFGLDSDKEKFEEEK